MNDQNKTKIKIQIKQCPIKVAFQSNIFKYIQKKKQQASIFSSLNKKYSSSQKNTHVNSSNLIQKKKQILLNQNNHEDFKQLKIQSTKKNILTQRKFNVTLNPKKTINKGYKSTLSDWRNLYQDREQISHRKLMFNQQKQRMIATDRLFYPSKRQNCSKMDNTQNLSNQKQYKNNHSERKNKIMSSLQTKDRMMFNTISNFRNLIRQRQLFDDGQNFFQLYHRSRSPIIPHLKHKNNNTNDQAAVKIKKRSKSGLGLMNEGILSDYSAIENSFVPYSEQQLSRQLGLQKPIQNSMYDATFYQRKDQKQKQINQFSQNFQLNQFRVKKRQNRINRKRIYLHMFNSQRIPQKNHQKTIQNGNLNMQNSNQNNSIQNPENSKNKNTDIKIMSNLSQIFSGTLDSKSIEKSQRENNQFQLKMFKPKKNKIENGIFNFKKTFTK